MSLPVEHDTQRMIEAAATGDGLSVDAYLRRVLLTDSLRRHAAWSAEHPASTTGRPAKPTPPRRARAEPDAPVRPETSARLDAAPAWNAITRAEFTS